MRVETGRLQGDLVLDEDTEIRGMVTGHVRVCAGATLVLNGTIGGCLVVVPGATAHINGVVGHHIYNAGGTVEIRGVVQRHLDTEAGETKVFAGSIIGGKRQTETFIHRNN